jgi:hypothetical protein
VLLLFVLCLFAAGCFGEGGSGPIDPTAGAACPTEHLVVGVRSNSTEVPSQVLRFDRNLRVCRGAVLEGAMSLDRVGGMSDGAELYGIDSRIELHAPGGRTWGASIANGALTIAGFVVGGVERVGVLGGDYSLSGATDLFLLDPASGSLVHTWEEGVSTSHAAMAPTGEDGHLLLLHDYEGVIEQIADLGSPSIGGSDLRVAPVSHPGGAFERVAIEGRTIAATTQRGVMYWTPATELMLGPRSCRWARVAGQTIPECAEYEALAMVPGNETRFIASCRVPEQGTWLVAIDLEDGCETLIDGRDLPDHTIVDVAWAGR